jgi:hypothetical protein
MAIRQADVDLRFNKSHPVNTFAWLACLDRQHLRASCPGCLRAVLNSENLIVKSAAIGFRASVLTLRFLDGKEDVNFHNFMLPEHRCEGLLVNEAGLCLKASSERSSNLWTLT